MSNTHPAIATVALGQSLKLIQAPTVTPKQGEIRVRVEWAASSPLELHQTDGGLLISSYPTILGENAAGTIVEVGPGVQRFSVGDKVFGFNYDYSTQQDRAYQVFITAPEYRFGKVPPSVPMSAAVTLTDNFVTAFNALVIDLGLSLPWPKPESFTPANGDSPILVWGGSGSVGQYVIQVLKHYGYTNILATASPKHHEKLKRYGAKHLFDYNSPTVVSDIKSISAEIPLIVDCIGSKEGSLAPISKIATSGALAAIILPVMVVLATAPSAKPTYSIEANKEAEWAPGVDVRGIQTHKYAEFSQDHRERLQPEVMPQMLEQGLIEPNDKRVVEGSTMLERATEAVALLRSGTVSGQRLVWRVWTEEEFPEYA